MQSKTAMFIGHRECYGLPETKLKQTIVECIEKGITVFLSGGQGGFDRAAAGTIYRLKEQYPYIKNSLVIPYLSFKIFDEAIFDEIIFPDGFEKYHYKAAIGQRNRYMVDHASVAICYVNQCFGGAAVTYEYAKKQHLEIVDIK